MKLHADFDQAVYILPNDYEWVDSPMPGVQRMMLDRVGDEVARATSLVRYAANSRFSEHVHSGGEEFLVLEGVFADEQKQYPAGSYVRNPIGTAHSPQVGDEGCLIFVKLHQFDRTDQEQKLVDTHTANWQIGAHNGIDIMPLHHVETEEVSLIRLAANTQFEADQNSGGKEILVLDGILYDQDRAYPKGSWIRSPHLGDQAFFSQKEGAMFYLKSGHLRPDSLKLPKTSVNR